MIALMVISCSFGQRDPLMTFTKKHFRSNPFERSFGDFVAHVVNDPQLTNKKTIYKTDSTLFVFTGTYSDFNPFGFKPQRVDVALVEQNVVMYEGRPQGDTIMLYILIAYGDTARKGLADVKKEYNRLNRRNSRMFMEAKEEDLGVANMTGAISNYFVNYAQMSPLSIEWIAGLVQQPILRVTLRIRSRGNETVLPMSLYDAQ